MILRTIVNLTVTITSLMFSAAAWSDSQRLRALHEQDRTVLRIGYRLAVANSFFCAPGEPTLGFSVHDLTQYPADERADARSVFGFDQRSLVLAVAPTSPAATAGLREGDALLAVDGVAVGASGPETGTYRKTQDLLDRLE
ncbi:MAG: PDZ domain-containing protein, partial [Zymomonas sp.]